jgi:hypothetical protein
MDHKKSAMRGEEQRKNKNGESHQKKPCNIRLFTRRLISL